MFGVFVEKVRWFSFFLHFIYRNEFKGEGRFISSLFMVGDLNIFNAFWIKFFNVCLLLLISFKLVYYLNIQIESTHTINYIQFSTQFVSFASRQHIKLFFNTQEIQSNKVLKYYKITVFLFSSSSSNLQRQKQETYNNTFMIS